MKKFEFEQKNLFGVCPFITAQEFLSRKWTIPILRELIDSKKKIQRITKKIWNYADDISATIKNFGI